VVETYFRLSDEHDQGGRYLPTQHTVGPWDPRLQHGGPPCALLTRAAERAAATATGRTDLLACRLAAEFLGPVPLGELTVTTELARVARSAVLVDARLSAGGREYLHARVWLLADRDTSAIAARPAPLGAPPENLSALQASFPYADSIEWREVHGSISTPGPGAVWARPHLGLLPDAELSGLQRAALVGDSASGISSALDWGRWSFVNVDLAVHLARPLHGEWLYLDATTQLGAHGFALARGTVADVHGVAGSTAQTLVLAPTDPGRPAD
jgi:hypothetical protein